MLFSGIDLHKRSLVIHTLDAEGVTTREAELRSDRAAVMAYVATLAGPHRGGRVRAELVLVARPVGPERG